MQHLRPPAIALPRVLFLAGSLLSCAGAAADAAPVPVRGAVVEVLSGERALRVEVESGGDQFAAGEQVDFSVGMGDLEIGYLDRRVEGEAVTYGGGWRLEKIFPLDGTGAKAMADVNARLHDETATMSRRKFVREGDFIPNFALIDQNGEFLQARQMRGKPFVLNFIFTRCQAATMCPASTTRMAALQDAARREGLDGLHFLTLSFDPEFDSPGILRQYASGYGIEPDRFHLLTGPRAVIDDLLRQFGILTIEEDGTINHTMATLLVDAQGKVAFRKEGSTWTVEEFLAAARKL